MVDRDRMMHFAAACFGAGFVTFLGLLMLEPSFGVAPAMGIALTVGAAVTYLGYRFRDVVDGIRRAARETMPWAQGVVLWPGQIIRNTADSVRALIWSLTHRPFMLSVLVHVYAFAKAFDWYLHLQLTSDSSLNPGAAVACGTLTAIFGLAMHHIFLYAAYATPEGAKKWHGRLNLPAHTHPHYDEHGECVGRDHVAGQQRCLGEHLHPFVVMSWRNAFALIWDAAIVAVPAAIIGVLRGIAGIAAIIIAVLLLAPIALAWFVWRAAVYVHSADRLIVMVDGPFGGVLTYALLRVFHGAPLAELPLAQQAGYMLLGGCASVALGMANAHLVAPAIQRFVHARARK